MVGLDVRYWLGVYHAKTSSHLVLMKQLAIKHLSVAKPEFDSLPSHVPPCSVLGCATFNLTDPACFNRIWKDRDYILGYCWSTYSGIRAKSCMWWKTMLHQNRCKRNILTDILLFFPGTAIAGRNCTPAILQHPSEGLQFNDVCIVVHIFVELLLVKKTKHLVDLTPFKQPLRSFLATELKPQNQTPRSLGHH